MITAIIQTRMGSKRLPGKVMMLMRGKPMLYYVINQVKNCNKVNKIIVATTTLKEDETICKYVKSLKCDIFRGSLSDVLDRYFQCAKEHKVKTILRVTSDDPLVDPNLIEKCIDKFESGNYDFVGSNIKKIGKNWIYDSNGFPNGIGMEVFTFDALKKAWQNAKKQSEREHVSPFIIKNPKLFKLGNIKNEKNYSNFRVTVDHKEDFKVVKKIIEYFQENEIFIMEKVVSFLKQNEEIKKINSKFPFMEGYLKSIRDETSH